MKKDNKKKLLVVESPTKARTIGKYLGDEYRVVATVGHLRDLPKSKMGVDLDHDFEIEYVIDPEKKKVVDELERAANAAGEIYLATDPDREGEAISYHVKWLLENSKLQTTNHKINLNISRVSFHEITKGAIEEALKSPREVDADLVDAQQGRRVLDRVVGYSLSPVLWRKVRRGLSAGRVQSVAVRLIVEREKEIAVFTKEKYFKVIANVGPSTGSGSFTAELFKVEGKNFAVNKKIDLFDGSYSYSKTIFDERKKAEEFVAGLAKEFRVDKVNERETSRTPLPPYTTSKLQQAAARRFGWSGKQTMTLAQRLYEKGLITYHRTDSVYLSDKAIGEFGSYIRKKYGDNYAAAKPRVFRNTSKNAQEAHEAIRPTTVEMILPKELDAKETKLYEMIWKRAVATQAAAARMKNTTVVLSNGTGLFKAIGIRMLFDGFLKITGEVTEEEVLPEIKEGEMVRSKKVEIGEAETNPPPRYSDASLVAALERQGIGRPSTYAPIISTIQQRQYVEKDEGRFKPTALGEATNEFLAKNFENIMSLPFTAGMEEELDEIALGKMQWKKMIAKFWKNFEAEVKKAEKEAERVKVAAEKIDEKCPECKEGDLVIRLGRFGKFISCSRFPDCKYTRQYREDAGFKCPTCGADGVVRKTKTGRRFYGCSNYPKCKWAGWKRP